MFRPVLDQVAIYFQNQVTGTTDLDAICVIVYRDAVYIMSSLYTLSLYTYNNCAISAHFRGKSCGFYLVADIYICSRLTERQSTSCGIKEMRD